jgi:L-iditol 2-dehydrogenase
MRAAILHGPRDVRIDTVPRPMPGPGAIRVRIDAALTGGTSTKIWRRGYHARMGRPPLPFGHEGAGTIDAVGGGVTRFTVGDRVVPANSAPCGVCRACSRGHTAQCADMVWLTGFFAEYLLVPPRIVEQNLHKIPEALPAGTAALSEILATVVKGQDRTPARRGERAVVLGTGPLGLLWIRVLAAAGVHVVAVGRRPEREGIARSLGAAEVVDADAFDPQAARADLVVEAVGSLEAWEMALAAAAPAGRVNLFGGPPEGTTVPLDTQRLHYEELLVSTSFHHTPYHFAEALRLLAAGFLDADLLVQETLPLDDLPAFMARAAAGEGPLKAAVTP